jgi:hypothetical protein
MGGLLRVKFVFLVFFFFSKIMINDHISGYNLKEKNKSSPSIAYSHTLLRMPLNISIAYSHRQGYVHLHARLTTH